MAAADIGIALGSGIDVAIETSDIVLMNDNILNAARSLDLSKKVMNKICWNLFWAFAYNSALIPLAAGIFYPV